MSSTLAQVLAVSVGVVVPLASFTTGLGAPRSGGLFLWKRPSLLLRSLLAILVLVPLWTFALVEVLPLPRVTKAGLLLAVIAVGIGPVAAMKRAHPSTSPTSYGLELNVIVQVLAIAFVPAAFAALAAVFRADVSVGVWPVAKLILVRALIPLAIGIGMGRLLPRYVDKLSALLAKVTTIAILVVLAFVLAISWRQLLGAGPVSWLACGAVACGALMIGHLMGGPEQSTRAVLAAESVMRFPALALLLASAAPQGKRLVPVVFAYVVVAAVGVAVYSLVMKRWAGRSGGEASAPPRLATPGTVAGGSSPALGSTVAATHAPGGVTFPKGPRG